MSGKTIAGVIIIIVLLLIVGLFIGGVIYFYVNRDKHRPFKGITTAVCPVSGKIPIPKDSSGVPQFTCFTLGDHTGVKYNVYPGTIAPGLGGQLFSNVTEFTLPGGKKAIMNSEYCRNLCDQTKDCYTTQCVNSTTGTTGSCACSGYSNIPSGGSLLPDKNCKSGSSGGCTTVSVKSSSI